jgi:MFS family permease
MDASGDRNARSRPPTGRRGAFPALVVADFVSVTGSEISALAIPWFVLTTTGSAARTGVALAAEFVGLVVFGVPAGELVSRLGARRTKILADLVRATLIALVPVLHAAHALPFAVLLVILVTIGAFFPADGAAWDLMVTAVVGQDPVRLTRANGILGSVNEAGSLIGPALGGGLIALTSPTAVLFIDAGTYLVAFLLVISFLRAGRVIDVEGERAGAGTLLAGMRYLFHDRWLRTMSLGVAVMELAWTGMTAALPVLAFRGFDGNVRLAGLFLGAYGGGAMVGGLLSGRAVRRFGISRVAVGSYAGVAAGMWILTATPPAWGVIAAVVVVGIFTGCFMPALFTEIVLRTPAALRAKVLAGATVAFSVTGPLGFIGVGILLQHVRSIVPAFVAIAAVATVAAAIVATDLMDERRRSAEAPPRGEGPSAAAPPLASRSDP